MNIQKYMHDNQEDLRTIHEIITQFGFTVTVKFGYDNKKILFEFTDNDDNNNLLFIIAVNSYNEAIDLISLFNYIVEIEN